MAKGTSSGKTSRAPGKSSSAAPPRAKGRKAAGAITEVTLLILGVALITSAAANAGSNLSKLGLPIPTPGGLLARIVFTALGLVLLGAALATRLSPAANRLAGGLRREQKEEAPPAPQPPGPNVGVPPDRNPLFTGRNMELDQLIGMWSCYLVFALALAYVPTMAAGFVAGGGLSAPIRDPYLAVMELLILLLAPALVVAFAALYHFASPSEKTLSLSALVLVALMAGITICVHFVVLSVGRQANETTLPGFARLFSWTWPSMIYALDIAAWDFCLGLALLLVAPVFSGSRLAHWVRYGAILSGLLCLAGLSGAVLGNMNFRNIGIVGYAVVLPVVMLLMGRLFWRMPPSDELHSSRRLAA